MSLFVVEQLILIEYYIYLILAVYIHSMIEIENIINF